MNIVSQFAPQSVRRTFLSNEQGAAYQAKIHELRLYPQEAFANKEGTRVVSRWRATGKNNGMLGTKPDNRPVEFTGVAIWEIRGGKLAHNWVEKSAWELYQQLTAEK